MKINKPNLVECTFFTIENNVHHLQDIALILKKKKVDPVIINCLNNSYNAILNYCNILYEYLDKSEELGLTPDQREKLIDDYNRSIALVGHDISNVVFEIGQKDIKDKSNDI